MRKLAPCVFVAVLSACAAPSDRPTAGRFYDATDPQTGQKIPVERLANAPMEPFNPARLGYSATDQGLSVLRSTGFADSRLRRGDVIEVTTLDTGEEGMFSSAQSKTLNLGRFTVDSAGTATSRGLVGSYHLATVTLSVGVARESTVAARGCNAAIPQLRAPAVSARRT